MQEDILVKYQKALLEENEIADSNELANLLRKQTAFGYLSSKQHLSNESSAFILKENLEKYSLASSNYSIYDTIVKKKLEKSNKPSNNSFLWKSNIQNTDFQKHLTFSDEYVPTDNELHVFQNAFKKKNETPKINNDPKPSTKSNFVPKVYLHKPISKQPKEVKEKETYGTSVFKTARQELNLQNINKYGNSAPVMQQKRKLGIRRSASSKFVSPMLSNESGDEGPKSEEWTDAVDERLKNIDPKMVELIKSEIMDSGSTVNWNDIAGLEFAKTAIQEAVVWPMLRPDLFTGLRRPPKGILLFGPPGTGKTLIGKCVASQSKSTFFSISASSLTSKWIGDGEKMVRALFAVARCHQPAVIFIDEIDSLLSQRNETEHESSRRIKTEFLVQLDGAATDNEERLLIIGATNRPQELDEAARRRLVKRLYIPLPEFEARFQLVQRLMSTERHSLSEGDLRVIAKLSDGYSGADMRNLCSDASLGPIRSIHMSKIECIQAAEVRPVTMEDFRKSLNRVRSSVSPKDLDQYVLWDNTYGSGSF